MFTKLRAVDIWVLETCVEPLSWEIESWTWLNNFQQARIALLIYLLFEYVWNQWIDQGSIIWLTYAFLLCIGFFLDSEYCESRSRRNTVPYAREDSIHFTLRLIFWGSMLFATLVVLLMTYVTFIQVDWTPETMTSFVEVRTRVLLMYGLSITMLLFSYLLACRPRPPDYEQVPAPQQAP